MQTSQHLFTEAELQRRMLQEISEIIVIFFRKYFYWEYFRKAGDACDMNIKRNILVHLGS